MRILALAAAAAVVMASCSAHAPRGRTPARAQPGSSSGAPSTPGPARAPASPGQPQRSSPPSAGGAAGARLAQAPTPPPPAPPKPVKPAWLELVEANAKGPVGRVIAMFELRGHVAHWARGIMSDEARAGADDAVRGYGFTVVSGDGALTGLEHSRRTAGCEGVSCELAAARAMGAVLMVSGEIAPQESGGYSGVMKLYEVANGTVVTSIKFNGLSTGEAIEKAYAAGQGLMR